MQRFLRISAAAVNSDDTGVVTHTVFLPVVFNRFDPSLGIPIFGVQMYGALNASTGITYAVDVGANWVRVPISWSPVEPTDRLPDQYNWAHTDARIIDAAQAGVHLIVTIGQAPSWAATYTDGPIDKVDLGEFTEFVGSLVERYDGDGLDDAPGSPVVNDWEFYNEPDAGDEFRARSGHSAYWGHFGDKYAEMLAAVYPVIKEANPNANIVFGGIAHDWFEDQGGPFVREFLDDVLAAEGGQYFDIMNFHAYPLFAPNWTTQGPGLLQKLEHIRSRMHAYGVDKPIIVTESGWHSGNGPPELFTSQEIQARYVAALFTQSMAGNTPVMIWWMLKEPGSYYWDNGLVDYNLSPKLAYVAYQAIVSELSTAHFERVLTVTETGSSEMEVYQFIDRVSGRDIYVAWLDPLETSDIQILHLVASRATVRDIYGNSYVVNDGDDGTLDGQVAIQVSGQPVYVEIAQ
jgi:hypothetical protein